jgi:hypothetical protein
MPSRRVFLTRALASGIALAPATRLFAANDFWNTKDPSTWTEDEMVLITSKSPWARATVPGFKGAADPTGITSGAPVEGGRGAGARRISGPQNVTIRWESAQPIRDALRAPLSADFDGHYVISVTNLPLAPRGRGRGADASDTDDVLDRLQNGATLQVKGKDPGEAGIARRTRIGSILFGFSKDYLPLTPADREIIFKLDTAQMVLQAKFDAKEMMYHGKLAV